jgi:hydrophobic/amphiphilic exporter-1 (mainly G- bacteria), HAE1 family
MLEDDAIVVSENITSVHARGEPPLVAAIKGAEQVFWPVIGTVLTTIVAFLPLLFVKGRIGDLMGALPWVVLFSLLVSVIETMTMLPSHMAHSLEARARRRPGRISTVLRNVEAWRDRVVLGGILAWYARFLRLSMNYRYITTAAVIGVLIISLGMVAGGRVDFTFLPDSDAETVVVDIRLPIGSPLARTESVIQKIEQAAQAQPEVKSISAIAGQQVNVDLGVADGSASHQGQIFIELTPVEARTRESSLVIDAIRQSLGDLPEVEMIRFSELGGAGGGPDITIRVIGEDQEHVNACVDALKTELLSYGGVHDVIDDNFDSQRELQIQLRPAASALGFNVSDVARQVRASLFGAEPHVFSAKREDIDVRVRLDEASRNDLSVIENLWVFNRSGDAVPLGEIAELSDGRSYSVINRVDRRRTVSITADTAPGTNPERVVNAIQGKIDELRRQHPAVAIELAGRQRDLADAFESLPVAYIVALLLVYVILATLFSSFAQPLVVMIAIPFSVIGVVWGHFLLGYQMTFLSLIGFVALTGVVVNNSLILIEFYNHKRAEGAGLLDGLIAAGRDRFRAIVLTSVTTFFGLAPLVFEQSFQAKFLIPMAISISFGLLSSTIVVLTALPCFMVILDDFKRVLHYLWFGTPRESSDAQSTPTEAVTESE